MALMIVLIFLFLLKQTTSIHHMNRALTTRQSGSGVPLIITNQCASDTWPGIVTQHGTGPDKTGFKLGGGESMNQTVSDDWQGRVWGRTNCSFNDQGFAQGGGVACQSGDCGGGLTCMATVRPTALVQSLVQMLIRI